MLCGILMVISLGVKGEPLRHSDAIHAKTMSLLEGLKLAKSKGVRGVDLVFNVPTSG